MTNLIARSPFEMFKDFDKIFVGFDDQYNKLVKIHDDLTKNIPNYPPYNIKKIADNQYVIELAVAGFTRSSIDIKIEEDKLMIHGFSHDDDEAAPEEYLFKGIAQRAFTRTFALSDRIEVKSAEMINGMLKVFLEKIIPEHKKPRSLEIKEPGEKPAVESKAEKQLLVEQELPKATKAKTK